MAENSSKQDFIAFTKIIPNIKEKNRIRLVEQAPIEGYERIEYNLTYNMYQRIQARLNESNPGEKVATPEAMASAKEEFDDYFKQKEEMQKGSPKKYDDLISQQQGAAQQGKATTVADSTTWKKSLQEKNLKKYKEATAAGTYRKEDHTDPAPLLSDKISSLPADSARRRNVEIVKGTLDNSVAVSGYGLDALTRESYKDVTRLVKSSEMLQNGIQEPMPTKSNMIGIEDQTVVNNMQNWKATFANATKPVSDAIGSHADVNSSIEKNPMGPAQILPQSSLMNLKDVSTDMVSNLENPFKNVQKSTLIQIPQKETGSLRHITTAANKLFSVPFDIASDTYTGLMNLINKAAKLLDAVVSKIVSFAISAVGGLIDAIIPPGLLSMINKFISLLLKTIDKLFSMLGGFSALAKIAGQMLAEAPLGCAGNVFGLNKIKNPKSKKLKTNVLGPIVGGIPGLGTALGNIGFSLNGRINPRLGSSTSNIFDPNLLTNKVLGQTIQTLLSKLPFICSVGTVGNKGYSCANMFDNLTNHSFSIAMTKYASHASIISGNFNKKSIPVGSYAKEDYTSMFEQLPYVKGAQGNKGMIMHGPGGTAGRKVFRL